MAVFMDVVGVRVVVPLQAPVLLLRETDGPRYLPVWIGPEEATHITTALSHEAAVRPLVHEIFLDSLSPQQPLCGIEITDYVDGIFSASLDLGEHDVDARLSDAVILALLAGVSVQCDEHVLDLASVCMCASEDMLLADFHTFLDAICPADFNCGPSTCT
ncbi:MAG: bifunctional nuclease family protein [Propionibacteriaceae bacterium]